VSFLLDTNVLSEWVKPQPSAAVARWLAEADEDGLFLSVVSLAELRRGVERLAESARRRRLESWITEELRVRFETRILPVDPEIADAWGRAMARSEAAGARMNVMDGFLAATSEVHKLTLVTRNVSDFEAAGCAVFSPWAE